MLCENSEENSFLGEKKKLTEFHKRQAKEKQLCENSGIRVGKGKKSLTHSF